MSLDGKFKRMMAENIDKANDLVASGMTTTEAKDCLKNFVHIVDQLQMAYEKVSDDSKLAIMTRKYEDAKRDMIRFKRFKDATVSIFADSSKEIQESCREIEEKIDDANSVRQGVGKVRTTLKSMIEAFAKSVRKY